jgi:hypothetical protein
MKALKNTTIMCERGKTERAEACRQEQALLFFFGIGV